MDNLPRNGRRRFKQSRSTGGAESVAVPHRRPENTRIQRKRRPLRLELRLRQRHRKNQRNNFKKSGIRQQLHENYSFNEAEVVFAARNEYAHTVEDVLARRVRLLFLDARAAKEAAPRVAQILSAELGRDSKWQEEQIAEFDRLADGYILSK